MSTRWKVKLHDEELLSCGFATASEDNKWKIIHGLLLAKGLPADVLFESGPLDMEPVEGGVEMVFG